jgi:hypothetical protein
MKYLITSICDENGDGQVTFSVNDKQLLSLLDKNMIYEDEVSEYVETSWRRHFHPNWEVANEIDILVELMEGV